MADAHADIAKHVKLYIGVFVALAVFTVLTVAVSRIEFGTAGHVTMALLIAVLKGALVASIFMHLKWEKGVTLWLTFAIAAIFFVALMALPALSVHDMPPGATMGTWG